MTEQEWSKTAPALGQMLHHLADSSSERKLRLFLHACCCRIQHALTDDCSRKALTELERLIEGRPGHWNLATLHSLAKEASDAVEAPLYVDGILRANSQSYAANAILCATSSDLRTTRTKRYSLSSLTSAVYYARGVFAGEVYRRTSNREKAEAADAAEAEVQVALLRDIFGNPFRTVTADSGWLTSTVVQLARGIYDDRAFDRMPILADALQDAGCDTDDILGHCRGPGPHVRGCWVVDLVLGKA